MKTIILVRHAKSSWEYDLSDRQRPLKNRGLKDAKLVSEACFKLGNLPEKYFSSPAKRALETSKIFLKTLKIHENELTIIEDLYDFSGESVISFIKSINNRTNSVMIFGHNHAFTLIANELGDRYIGNLPTSGLVKITFDIEDWNYIKKGKTELVIFPRDLKD